MTGIDRCRGDELICRNYTSRAAEAGGATTAANAKESSAASDVYKRQPVRRRRPLVISVGGGPRQALNTARMERWQRTVWQPIRTADLPQRSSRARWRGCRAWRCRL